ncbi:MAG: CinA family protein [Prevotella sp.]|nr:CinA family protein [Prevotella sp.]MDY6229574.1 CinA family protein [Prevotella sp.]
MKLEDNVRSRELQQYLYESGQTIGTAESCTGGKISEAIIGVPGASTYFKGGIVAYTEEIKETLLFVDPKLIEEKNVVSEEVAVEMVKGAIKTLGVDYAIASTGVAGPAGGTPEIPVGTIWLACGNKDEVVTLKLDEDNGRDINIGIATSKALQLAVDFVSKHIEKAE